MMNDSPLHCEHIKYLCRTRFPTHALNRFFLNLVQNVALMIHALQVFRRLFCHPCLRLSFGKRKLEKVG